ncbi:MAG TPA: glycosyltransferase family 2 protein, partial [Desulfobacterales bacterium]|nr:glycosyltransferase family 2 protein [Desulfobacterales bacterium]
MPVVLLVASAVALGALAFATVTNLVNLACLRRLGPSAAPRPGTTVTVVVPARNEERNLWSCLQSLLEQDGVGMEVILVDDHSTDGTPAIARRLSQRYSGLRVIRGAPLPEGWLGKHWACHQGAEAARGDLILFTDADTFHAPRSVASAAAALQATGSDLLSALTAQDTWSLSERAVAPLVFWLVYSLFPFALMNRSRSFPLFFGNGQFLMLRRDAYERLGGYAAIRAQVFDDMAIARRARQMGLKTVVVDGSRLVSCRMYDGFREVVRGLGKNLFPLFRLALPPTLARPLFVLGFCLLALILVSPAASVAAAVACRALGVAAPAALLPVSACALALTFATLAIVYRRLRFPVGMIL